MKVHYRTKSLERICTNLEVAIKKYNVSMAEKIHIRIDQIKAADSVAELVHNRIGRCHSLQGDRRGQYAMNLEQPYRLIFTEENEETVSVRIDQITDYH